MPTVRDRAMHFLRLEAAFDWEAFFEPLGVQCHGHTGKDSVHVKRFCRRQDVFLGLHDGMDMSIEDGFSNAADPSDVILVTKHFICSKEISQMPLRFLPACLARVLPGVGPTAKKERNWMTEDLLQRYEKTANHICRPPWHMDKATDYLLQWCEKNRQRIIPNPPVLGGFVLGGDRLAGPAKAAIEWVDFAPDRPLQLRVLPQKAKAKAKPKLKAKARATGEVRAEDVAAVVPLEQACVLAKMVGEHVLVCGWWLCTSLYNEQDGCVNRSKCVAHACSSCMARQTHDYDNLLILLLGQGLAGYCACGWGW